MSVLLLLLAQAAAPSGGAGEIAALPVCAPPTVADRAGWSRVSEPPFSLSLPPGSRKDASARFVHGGSAWEGERRHAQMSWGMWGLSSFDALVNAIVLSVCEGQ